MIFNIVHTTAYEYSAPAIESFTELRVRPRQSNRQIVHDHVTEVTPRAVIDEFTVAISTPSVVLDSAIHL